MLVAVAIMGGLGVIIGIGLAAASKIFYVYVDPKIVEVESALPGANCGGCGYPGCGANAEAIVKGKSSPSSCVAGGSELAATIAAIMGVSVEAKEPDIARPGCYYGVKDADVKFIYDGLSDCRAAALLSGGMKVCSVGCLGLGSCVKACPFNALSMGPEGLPVVDEKKCTGCGTCERVCPKHIINLSSVTRRILKEYTTDECTTPCQRTCPAGINIREYIRQIMLGDYHKSVQVIKERLPFPTVIGRICPRFCETECRRKYVDEPVAINHLKRFVCDYEKESGQRIHPFMAPKTGKKLAIVGGGVEGLSAAYFSARLGHEATVFESSQQLGGLLRMAIARYRLPEEILDWDINGILAMGVSARTGMSLGKNITIDALLSEFEAVFLAAGGWDSRLLRGTDIERTIPGTYLLIDLLRFDAKQVECRSQVVIAGGGKLAVEAALKCKKQGSDSITVLFRESQEACPIEPADLQKLEEQKINVVCNAGITRIMGEGKNLTAVEYMDFETKTKTVVPTYSLFIASGRLPELIFVPVKTDGEISKGPLKWEGIEPYKQPLYSGEIGLLAEGDTLSDFSAAIKAIGAGRRAAASMHQFIYGFAIALPEHAISAESVLQNTDQIEGVKVIPRQIMPLCSEKELDTCGILELGFTEKMAHTEANRCLQCGLICYEHH